MEGGRVRGHTNLINRSGSKFSPDLMRSFYLSKHKHLILAYTAEGTLLRSACFITRDLTKKFLIFRPSEITTGAFFRQFVVSNAMMR